MASRVALLVEDNRDDEELTLHALKSNNILNEVAISLASTGCSSMSPRPRVRELCNRHPPISTTRQQSRDVLGNPGQPELLRGNVQLIEGVMRKSIESIQNDIVVADESSIQGRPVSDGRMECEPQQDQPVKSPV